VQKRTVALEQAVTTNSQTLGQIVNVINQSNEAAQGTTAPTE
jgi:hypothetical protein